MAYKPYNPYDGQTFVPTTPDYQELANTIGGLAQNFQKMDMANRQADIDMYRTQAAAAQESANNMLSYMQEIRLNRLQESKQAMDMLRMTTELKEVNYKMEQARKLDDAKWQAREARSQILAGLADVNNRLNSSDITNANDLLTDLYKIPGASDDEVSMKLLAETSAHINQYKIGDQPAVQVLSALRNQVTAEQGSTAWAALKENLSMFPGTDIKELSRKLALQTGDGSNAATYEAYLRRGSGLMTPEKAQKVNQFTEELQAKMLNDIAAVDTEDPLRDDKVKAIKDKYEHLLEFGRQTMIDGKYSIFNSSTGPTEGPTSIVAKTQSVKGMINEALNNLQQVKTNAKTRAAWLRNKPLDRETYEVLAKSDPQSLIAFNKLMQQRSPLMADTGIGPAPEDLNYYWTGEEGQLKKLNAEIDFHTQNMIGALSQMEADPNNVTEELFKFYNDERIALNSKIAKFYGGEGTEPIGWNFLNPVASKSIASAIQRNRVMKERTMNALSMAPAGTQRGYEALAAQVGMPQASSAAMDKYPKIQ